MSDTTIAILILPFLIALTVALECTRVGCTKLARRVRGRRESVASAEESRVGARGEG